MQQTVWQNVFIQSLYLLLKTQLFRTCLAWNILIGSTYPAVDSIPTVYT